MTDLRTKIADAISSNVLTMSNNDGVGHWRAADAILALPEIADAYRTGFVDGCNHMKEDYEAGDRLDKKALTAERDALQAKLDRAVKAGYVQGWNDAKPEAVFDMSQDFDVAEVSFRTRATIKEIQGQPPDSPSR